MTGSQEHRRLEDCILRATKGAVAAANELLEEIHEPVRAFLERKTSDALKRQVGVDDILQDTLFAIHMDLGRFAYPGISGFWSWVWTIAFRRIRDRAVYVEADKRSWARTQSLDDVELSGDVAPDLAPEDREIVERARKILQTMKSDVALVVWLMDYHGLTCGAVSTRLGIPETTVRRHRKEGRAVLARRLQVTNE